MKSSPKLRQEIAAAAARIVALEGVSDYLSAKKKAAIQLGLTPNKNLPTNQEIENALISYQGLFQSDKNRQVLLEFRQTALQAMKLLSKYRPLLVGPVVSGTVTRSSEVVLHLYSDDVEQIGLYLNECGIPCSVSEKNLRLDASTSLAFPAYRFVADQIAILLIVFSEKDRNLSPISSITNKPMQTMSLAGLEAVIAEDLDPTSH